VSRRWEERRSSGNFISFILLHLKAVIYACGEVRRNAPRKNEREGERKYDGDVTCVPVCARKRDDVAIIIDMLACKRCLLRLPVRGSGGDLPGPCAFPHCTQIQLFIDTRRIDRCYFSNASRIASSLHFSPFN